jgi:1-acyl-sn-glycerol-3-phosphate acyltransferase
MPRRTADESLVTRWARRCVSVPGYLLAAILALLALPAAIIATVVLDARDLRRAPRTRFVIAVAFLLLCEAVGIVGSFFTWTLAGGPWGQGSPRADRLDRALQRRWAGALFAGGRRIFGLGLSVAGDAARGASGPLIVLARHASLVDSLLPVVLLPRLRLRYVLKRELRWDPCLDLVGSRLPNAFVRRGARDPEEIERVRLLARDLAADEGVVLFPEGTRFTPERRRRLLERLDGERSAPRRREAGSLRHTLPPRRGGVLALLDAAPAAEVAIVVHAGLEGAARLGDLWRGALVGGTIEVAVWRVPRAAIPGDAGGREAWLDDCWRRVDDWIAERRRGRAELADAEPGRPAALAAERR